MVLTPDMVLLFVSGFLLFLVLTGTLGWLKWRRRMRQAAKRKEPAVRRCPCGYPLIGLEIPRCPECGRVVGFDVSFAELGVEEEEVRQHFAAKRKGLSTNEHE